MADRLIPAAAVERLLLAVDLEYNVYPSGYACHFCLGTPRLPREYFEHATDCPLVAFCLEHNVAAPAVVKGLLRPGARPPGVHTAIGEELDRVAERMLVPPRTAGETDQDLRARVLAHWLSGARVNPNDRGEW